MYETWAAQKRWDEAKRVTKSVVDHTLYLIWIHEQNALVLYSDTLAKQVPRSRSANAFNIFREAMHQIEVVRLCALWDAAKLDRESIPTAIELIDSDEVISLITEEARAQYAHVPPGRLTGISEGEAPAVLKAVQEAHRKTGEENAERAAAELRTAIKDARKLRTSDMVTSMRHLRDQQLAHNLVKAEPGDVEDISPMKYGDERKILEQTLVIIETLYRWVNGTGISFQQSREIDRKCVEGLWSNCALNITY